RANFVSIFGDMILYLAGVTIPARFGRAIPSHREPAWRRRRPGIHSHAQLMDFFNYKNGELYCEDVPAAKIAAEVGTPAYVYSKATFLYHYRQIAEAFKPLNATVCYSIKSCGNINILKTLAAAGCGFDVTSDGELFRALQAGGDPKKIIYAGVGKTD